MGARHGVIWGLACLMAVGSVFDGAAQTVSDRGFATRTCGDELRAARAEYQEGAYAAAIRLASECLQRAYVTPNEAVDAYRMLALAHLKRNDLAAARTEIVNLLGADPDYEPDHVEEPPVFVSMVSLVRHQLQLDRPSMPVEKVRPRPVAVLRVQGEARPPGRLTADRPTDALPEAADAQRSFFRRPGTWMTVGGVLIGSGVRSGEHVRGIGIGGLGVGAGGRFTGIGIGGLGVGGGEALEGIMLGGVAVGSGARLDGIAIGGLGVGSGGHVRGLSIGGLGVGSGRSIRGLTVGGLGVGTGGNITGGAFALLVVGGGETVTGFTAAGLGIGAGTHLRGLHLTGVGIVAPRISGVVVAPIVSSQRVAGVVVAPLYMRVAEDGYLRGFSVAPLHHVRGTQQGFTVGLINVAHALQGVQLGLFNYAGNNPWPLRLLPGINLHF